MESSLSPGKGDGQPEGSELDIGSVVGNKYKVIRTLGRGGFGAVYLVEILQGIVGDQLALKLIPKSLSGNERVRERFMNEIRVAMRLVNKYIVQVRDVGVTESGDLYYTMDYSPGKPLSQVLKREGVLDIRRAVSIALRVLRGLGTPHQQGVIHRDLKPANLMIESVDGKETVRILDFGIATAVGNRREGRGFVGSPYYMPPEQFEGKEVGTYTDLYAVGVVLYECLTGERPYRGSSAKEIYAALKNRPAKSPRRINPELNECLEVVRVVMKSLERNPANRYRDSKVFFADLKEAFEVWKKRRVASPELDGPSHPPSRGPNPGSPRTHRRVVPGGRRSRREWSKRAGPSPFTLVAIFVGIAVVGVIAMVLISKMK